MIDTFVMKQLMKLLHAPICIYDQAGNVVQEFEELEGKKIIEKSDFGQITWKYENEDRKILGASNRVLKDALAFPYIHVEENGIAYCVLQTEEKERLIGLGKVRIYQKLDDETRKYPYCDRDAFTTIISMLWKLISGQEVSSRKLWEENTDIGFSLPEEMTKDFFAMHEEGKVHNPYTQELREQDSIRRGDIQALQDSIDEAYSGTIGILAGDEVRQYKNIAICVISCATRSAIAGGINPERAFAMSDTFIRNVEENLNDPIKIEQATREAEFEFARAVQALRIKKSDNPLIDQVRDYVFCHIHEAIRVHDIADYVGVTPNYLSEQFSAEMGMTLKQYIIDEKITSSEQLLKYTDYSLQEISSFCAFSSQSRFSVYFQRKNGITPAKYRKRFRKQINE